MVEYTNLNLGYIFTMVIDYKGFIHKNILDTNHRQKHLMGDGTFPASKVSHKRTIVGLLLWEQETFIIGNILQGGESIHISEFADNIILHLSTTCKSL